MSSESRCYFYHKVTKTRSFVRLRFSKFNLSFSLSHVLKFFNLSYVLILALLFSVIKTQAQTEKKENCFCDSRQDPVKLNLKYFGYYYCDLKYMVVSPFSWKGKNWLTAGAIIGTTTALYFLDQGIHDWVLDHHNNFFDPVFKYSEFAGNPKYTFPTLGALYLGGLVFKSEKAQRVSLLSLESLALAGLFTYAIKTTAQRHRPRDGDPYNIWDGPDFTFDNLSFPSGHSTSAWAIATVFAKEFNDTKLVPVIAYSIASLTSLSRVYENHHWTSDVFFGAVIGYFTGKTISKLHQKGSKLSFTPIISRDSKLLGFSYQF